MISRAESAGVSRTRYNMQVTGLETTVQSIADKRDRYDVLATRYAELSGGADAVTAVVIGQREQKHLTSLIRDALQNAGQLERDSVTVETRVLSLIDQDEVLVRPKQGDITPDWRLFNREDINVAAGGKLVAVAASKSAGIKAKDRLTVSAVSATSLKVEHKGKAVELRTDQPFYSTHGYVAPPGGRDNDSDIVLAALNARDITAQTMKSLAQSGDRAEVFTAETTERAEARLQRMQSNTSPVQLVRWLSGREDMTEAVSTLQDGVKSGRRWH